MSCTYNYIETETPDDGVSFSSDVQPIFDDNCSRCHSMNLPPSLQSGESYDQLIFGNYIDIENPNESELILKINSNHPSAGVPTSGEISTITLWIEEGALNN